jgi:8-oxo-dGTP pyrophosphatase MutT (NUDIX family)
MEYPTAVCLLLQNGDKFLATTRRGTTDAWGLPGGKVDPMEGCDEALIREIQEETGLALDPELINFVHVSECGPEKDGRIFTCYAYTYNINDVVDEPRNMEEGILVDWVNYEDLVNGPFGEYNKRLFDILNIQS